MTEHFVSKSCEGEKCAVCTAPAKHKIEETIFWDDPIQNRHGFTAYLCHPCFVEIMGPAAA